MIEIQGVDCVGRIVDTILKYLKSSARKNTGYSGNYNISNSYNYSPYDRRRADSNQSTKSNNNKQDKNTRRAYLNTSRNGEDYRKDYQFIRSGEYYILEIVRPATRESRDLYALDGSRNVNGMSRIVSKQRMRVETVVPDGSKLRLYCTGVDNFGRRADGWYIFYQTPDSLNRRDTYVLSITKC